MSVFPVRSFYPWYMIHGGCAITKDSMETIALNISHVTVLINLFFDSALLFLVIFHAHLRNITNSYKQVFCLFVVGWIQCYTQCYCLLTQNTKVIPFFIVDSILKWVSHMTFCFIVYFGFGMKNTNKNV